MFVYNACTSRVSLREGPRIPTFGGCFCLPPNRGSATVRLGGRQSIKKKYEELSSSPHTRELVLIGRIPTRLSADPPARFPSVGSRHLRAKSVPGLALRRLPKAACTRVP